MNEIDLYEHDDLMDRCRYRAAQLYQADGVLSHERVADGLGRFVVKRLSEEPATPARDALISVIASEVRTATYLSCGQKLIRNALTKLIRFALVYVDHPDYRPEWRP